MDRIDSRSEWLTFEAKAKSINQERRSEEVQLEKLKLRLQDKMQQVELRESGRPPAAISRFAPAVTPATDAAFPEPVPPQPESLDEMVK